MAAHPFIEINIHPRNGFYNIPNGKTLFWISTGVVLVAATGGVAAGVAMSGGTWAMFGATALTKGTAVAHFIWSNAARAVVGATAVTVLNQVVKVNRRED